MSKKTFNIKTLFAVSAILLVTLSCKEDRNQTKLQYLPDMADNPTVKAQEDYLEPPKHSVASSAVLYPETDLQAETEFRNPLPPGIKEHIQQGKELYEIYCVVCHGEKGDGKGTLGTAYLGGVVPSIITDVLKAKKDGFYFQKISKGGPIMPSYGHATHYLERWKMIAYLRTLQQ